MLWTLAEMTLHFSDHSGQRGALIKNIDMGESAAEITAEVRFVKRYTPLRTHSLFRMDFTGTAGQGSFVCDDASYADEWQVG